MARKGERKWRWETLVDDVKSNCEVSPSGCFLWQGGQDKDGYPKLYIDGKHWRGNRAILYAITRDLDIVARHSCDTPPCLNPEHLIWGTYRDNTLDAVERGRQAMNLVHRSGEQNGNAKLSDRDRDEIIRLSRDGMSAKQLAGLYPQVSLSRIQDIRRQYGVAAPSGRVKSESDTCPKGHGYMDSADGVKRCRECRNEASRRYRAKDPEAARQKKREWRASRRERGLPAH